MQNITPNPSLCAHVTQDSNAQYVDPYDRSTKKPYIRPTFHRLDDVIEKTKVTDYTELGQSVCSANGS